MRKTLAMLGATLIIPAVLSTASPAMADSNWTYCHYDESGNYLGATSKATGERVDVTQEGCETDYPLAD